MDFAVFTIAGAIVLGGALGVIISKNPVHSALSLVASLFGIAALFVQQEANLLAAVQVIVYTGAIVVLILFVLMLLGVDKAEALGIDPVPGQRPAAVLLGAVGLVALSAVMLVPVMLSDNDDATVDNTVITGERSAIAPVSVDPDAAAPQVPVIDPLTGQPAVDPLTGQPQLGPDPTFEVEAPQPNIEVIGEVLFTDYVFVFEVTALLLTIAVVGAVMLARRPDDPQPLPPDPDPYGFDGDGDDEEEEAEEEVANDA